MTRKWIVREVAYAFLGFVAAAVAAMLTVPSQAQMLHQRFIESPSGTRLGYTLERGEQVEAYDRTGSRLGHYDKRDGFTYDRTGRRIAKGNILSYLIVENAHDTL